MKDQQPPFQNNEKEGKNIIERIINNKEDQKDNNTVQNPVKENKIHMGADNTKNGGKEEESRGKGENYSDIESLDKFINSNEMQHESNTITNENNQDEQQNNAQNTKNSKEREPPKQQQNEDSKAEVQNKIKKQDFYKENKDYYKESSSDQNNRETYLTENEKELKKEEDIKLKLKKEEDIK